MSINPFDDDNGSFLVLVNDEEQHSLWPDFADIPVARRAFYGEADRAACLDYIEPNRPDIRCRRVCAPGPPGAEILRCSPRIWESDGT